MNKQSVARFFGKTNASVHGLKLRSPIVFMVLAATAIPIELRMPLGPEDLGFGFHASDIVLNIIGYVPVGVVLAELGLLRAMAVAAVMSLFAETGQLVMVHRDPSVVDVGTNVMGAFLGGAAGVRWGIRQPVVRITRRRALGAATLAITVVLGVWAISGDPLNPRGATESGILEAHWKFDEPSGRAALDSSGHGLRGKFSGKPKYVAGVVRSAAQLDGRKDYIDFGQVTAFRLVGSMTISAWINATSFPRDDAAIVSSLAHSGSHGNQSTRGFQLDTTVDRGPRAIGFKLGDGCQRLVARYGATPLITGVWQHIAGVYDARAQTLDVYLNGERDNGALVGSVTVTQRSSRERLYVGRRADSKGYEFAGSIDDVRIYSRALTKAEIQAVMRGTAGESTTATQIADNGPSGRPPTLPETPDVPCGAASDREDAKIPGAAAMLGVFAAAACIGLWPSGGPLACVVAGFGAGLLLLPATAPTLPALARWTMPLVSLFGGASVAVSLFRPWTGR